MDSQKPILLIEDDRVDAMTVRRALKELNVTIPLKTVNNGEDALAYLKGQSNIKPCIILLDLNMPRMNGIEFLQIAKQDDLIKRIPVIVLTTSSEQQDKFDSFNLGIAGYMLKPVDYPQFVEMMRVINKYWTLSELPED